MYRLELTPGEVGLLWSGLSDRLAALGTAEHVEPNSLEEIALLTRIIHRVSAQQREGGLGLLELSSQELALVDRSLDGSHRFRGRSVRQRSAPPPLQPLRSKVDQLMKPPGGPLGMARRLLSR